MKGLRHLMSLLVISISLVGCTELMDFFGGSDTDSIRQEEINTNMRKLAPI